MRDQLAMFGGPVVEPAPSDPDLARIGATLPPQVRFGTSSWSFPGWAGQVWKQPYPQDWLSAQGLSAYAPHLVVRWNLGGGRTYEDAKSRYAPFDRVVDPEPGLRRSLADAVRWAIERDRPVWVTANNKAEGSAPGTLAGIARLLA